MSENTYYQRNKEVILNIAKAYYEYNKERLREKARNKKNIKEIIMKLINQDNLFCLFLHSLKNETKSLNFW